MHSFISTIGHEVISVDLFQYTEESMKVITFLTSCKQGAMSANRTLESVKFKHVNVGEGSVGRREYMPNASEKLRTRRRFWQGMRLNEDCCCTLPPPAARKHT